MLKESLRAHLTSKEIESLSSSFDVVGDIAIVKIPADLKPKARLIGDQIIQRMKNVKTVLSQDSDIQGEFRTRTLSFISGEEKFVTVYKESGILFKVDVAKAYFSPRLSTERLRIRSMVSDGEKIFNMFAGVGTFSLVIAKTKECEIYSVDKNPEAIKLAQDSLKLNKKLKGVVLPVLADAREFADINRGKFDRVLMPLPELAPNFLPSAVVSARPTVGAVIHYYIHVPEDDFYNADWLTKHLASLNIGREFKIKNWKKVREVGPRFIQAVADISLS